MKLTIMQSFVGGIIAFRALPRPSFSTLQSAIFPTYFIMQTALPAVLALTFPGSASGGVKTASGLPGVMEEPNRYGVLFPISTIFVLGLTNAAYLGPVTTQVMKQRKHQGVCGVTFPSIQPLIHTVTETRDGKKYFDPGPHSTEMQRLNKRFTALHGASSLVNLVAFLATIWYGGTLAEMLK